MKLIYERDDILRILRKHHSYGNEPIKVDYTTMDVLSVDLMNGQVVVVLGKEEDDEVQ